MPASIRNEAAATALSLEPTDSSLRGSSACHMDREVIKRRESIPNSGASAEKARTMIGLRSPGHVFFPEFGLRNWLEAHGCRQHSG